MVVEYVGIGHIDRVCDLIAQRLLTEYLIEDIDSRVAIEVSCSADYLMIFGEVTSKCNLSDEDIIDITRKVLEFCGYDKEYYNPKFIINLKKQSLNISQRVHKESLSFGDQNIAVGYAYNDHKFDWLPKDYFYARMLVSYIENTLCCICDYLTKDIKVVLDLEAKRCCCSIQTKREITREEFDKVSSEVLFPLRSMGVNNLDIDLYPRTDCLCDCGTTNRKIGVDMYGSCAKMDGGGYNGKDFTKGDMSGKILAKAIAIHLLKSKTYDTEEINVILEFNMGVDKPKSLVVEFEGNRVSYKEEQIANLEKEMGFEFTLEGVIKHFKLRKYANTLYLNSIANKSFHVMVERFF